MDKINRADLETKAVPSAGASAPNFAKNVQAKFVKKPSPAERLMERQRIRNKAAIDKTTDENLKKALAAVDKIEKVKASDAPSIWKEVKAASDKMTAAIRMVYESILAMSNAAFIPLLNRMDIEPSLFNAQIDTMTTDLNDVSKANAQIIQKYRELGQEETINSADVAIACSQQLDSMMQLMQMTIIQTQSELFEKANFAFSLMAQAEGYDPQSEEARPVVAAYASLHVCLLNDEQRAALVAEAEKEQAGDKNVVTDVEFTEVKEAPAV